MRTPYISPLSSRRHLITEDRRKHQAKRKDMPEDRYFVNPFNVTSLLPLCVKQFRCEYSMKVHKKFVVLNIHINFQVFSYADKWNINMILAVVITMDKRHLFNTFQFLYSETRQGG